MSDNFKDTLKLISIEKSIERLVNKKEKCIKKIIEEWKEIVWLYLEETNPGHFEGHKKSFGRNSRKFDEYKEGVLKHLEFEKINMKYNQIVFKIGVDHKELIFLNLRLIYFRHMTREELKAEFRRYIKD